MLTFEYEEEHGTLEIVCDEEGRDLLRRYIDWLKLPGDHEHLMTPSWSGSELTEELQSTAPGRKLIHMVTIHLVGMSAR